MRIPRSSGGSPEKADVPQLALYVREFTLYVRIHTVRRTAKLAHLCFFRNPSKFDHDSLPDLVVPRPLGRRHACCGCRHDRRGRKASWTLRVMSTSIFGQSGVRRQPAHPDARWEFTQRSWTYLNRTDAAQDCPSDPRPGPSSSLRKPFQARS